MIVKKKKKNVNVSLLWFRFIIDNYKFSSIKQPCNKVSNDNWFDM